MALLEVNDLHTSFFTDAGEVKAVDGVSFRLDHGKVLGIVGESGSAQKSRVKAEKTKIFFQKASSGFGDVSFKERSGRFKA